MDVLAATAGPLAEVAIEVAAEAGESAGIVINLFWVIVAGLNFVVFLFLLYTFFFARVQEVLTDRQTRIEEGLRDAETARRDREQGEQERAAALQEARREANEIMARSQKVAQDQREADIAATKADLERLRTHATSDIEAEKQKALADLRSEVATLALAAAGKVVRETMTDQRQHRLVEEFLRESATTPGGPKA